MNYPQFNNRTAARFLWRGETNARDAARKFLVLDRKITISDDDIAALIEVVYPPIANGVLSKAMQQMTSLGRRDRIHDTLEALDLLRKRWEGPSARSRP